MKLSDYVIQFFVDQGVDQCFAISGGAVIHLCDSAARNEQLNLIFTQHEQGAGAAADMYARVTKNIGLALVTSGPGATNLVTSVCNAYFDSIPCVFVSGQVATSRLRPNERLRQRGFQETDVVSIFRSITKYAVLVRRAEDIRYELEKAVHLARSGRPGPVLIDLPDDLQRVDVDPERLRRFEATADVEDGGPVADAAIGELDALIKSARRPVLILGAGIHMSHTEAEATRFAEHYHLPTLLTWGALDLLPRDHRLNMGGLGVVGPRSGNFAAQTSDLVIALGTRLSQMITGGKQELFAPEARKVMVDVDPEELAKFDRNTFELDLAIHADLRRLFAQWRGQFPGNHCDRFREWRDQIRAWDSRYPVCPESYYERTDRVNAYVFMNELSRASSEGDIIITDAGGNLSWTMQGIHAKARQQIYSAWNHSPMGYSMPAAMGAVVASDENVICIIGDGGLMMCVEELGTIRRHDMPITIFVFNNRGHGIQKQTIETWLSSHYVGVDRDTGLFFPDYESLARTFGIDYAHIGTHADLARLTDILRLKKPILVNVEIAEDQRITPMLKFGAGLEDLNPKLPAQEWQQIKASAHRLS